MREKINVIVLSCLIGIGMLACSVLPVRAMGPENCPHPYFADSVESIPTGNYDYRKDGHYAEYARIQTCLKCGFEVFTETDYKLESAHEWEEVPSEIYEKNGVTVEIFDCTTSGCSERLLRTSGVI